MIRKNVKVLAGLLIVFLLSSCVEAPAEIDTYHKDRLPTSSAVKTETLFTTMDTQSGVTWGLDRIDGTKDGSYTYLSSGSGVRIYIVDTGVDASHPDFGGRVLDGFDAFNENLDQTDCNGHGTHVAGIAAGSYFGVAKSATIIPVRVMNCSGLGNTTTLTAGIDWILSNNPAGAPAVVNMSLGGPRDILVNSAVSKLTAAGIVVTVAAGNSNADACAYSPASADGVISVGATTNTDSKSPFSNWGKCVDVFAPGSRISSNSPFNYQISTQKSGTSQAAPFVAGAIATYISNGRPSSPDTVARDILDYSEKDIVVDGASAYNNILNVEKIPAQLPPTTDPTTVGEPTSEPIPSQAPVVAPLPVPEPNHSVEPGPTLEPTPEPVEVPAVVDYNLRAYQSYPGSRSGWLKWNLVEGASYLIYKTSSIRPEWHEFATIDEGVTRFLLSDIYGSIAIYKIVALFDRSSVDMGEVTYAPSK